MRAKAYISEYDLQGEDIELPDEVPEEEWIKIKQTLITDFINKFKAVFRKKYNMDFNEFGKGFYTDNEMNRRLNRVGKHYDKAIKFKDRINEIIKERNIKVRGMPAFRAPEFVMRYRRWQEKEHFEVKKLAEIGLTAKQISFKLLRTVHGVYKSRGWREYRKMVSKS